MGTLLLRFRLDKRLDLLHLTNVIRILPAGQNIVKLFYGPVKCVVHTIPPFIFQDGNSGQYPFISIFKTGF